MELKTLKDLKRRDVMVANCLDETDYDIVEVKELKQEAIKWIKEISKMKCESCQGTKLIHPEYPEDSLECEDCDKPVFFWYGGASKWIKHFFNITEEELKDAKEVN